MQLPTDYTVHPHFVPITEWLCREDVDAVLWAGILAVAAGAFGLDLSAEHLNCSGLGVGAGYVTAVGIVADSERCQ
jgi:hypothetical protein